MTRQSDEQAHLADWLNQSMRVGGVECHLEPKVRLEAGTWVGAEALIRWRVGDCWIAPAAFVGVDGRSDLARRLGQWLLWEVAARLARWRRQGVVGEEFRVAVDLAAMPLDPELVQAMRGALAHHRLPGSALILQVAEGRVFDDPAGACELLQGLRDLGLAIALTDVGTGFPSMGLLRALPIDEIGLDPAFVRGLPGDDHARAIARSVIALGESLELAVVAKSVSNEAQRAALIGLGCRCGQGQLFQRALPPEEFEAALRTAPRAAPLQRRSGAGPC